ncbi:hypothetical protein ISG33_13930 [Glaciecola sp. MH2013]|uniref:hypothetical protein n=1 Tax=Glaciecola sp. MH2013 TaxID=2785524 RepID=UPI0018A0682C|nr:hypothetical protein [Glaciecola sp. MH2013]MBF7074501.1 hypothetical protein [Glaciecola sp. MH2013]
MLRSILIIVSLTFGYSLGLKAQDKSLAIEKNRVADFLFITDRKGADPLKAAYFEDMFPSAQQLGFQRGTAFKIDRPPISGMYYPDFLAIGSWPGNWEQRAPLFGELSSQKPDIRERRLAIWSSFNMLNFETQTAIDLQFDSSKIYVFGAYWKADPKAFSVLKKAFKNEVKQHNGKSTLLIEEAYSMFGYTDAADFLFITEWESQAAFDAFQNSMHSFKKEQLSNAALRASSEFYLSVPPKKG